MKVMVVTGSSRGIGFGMVRETLARGHAVVVSGSTDATTEAARVKLVEQFGPERILARSCDVREAAQIQALWDGAMERFGRVDIWINNAGVTHPFLPIGQLESEDLIRTIDTDVRGVVLCCRIAAIGMVAQGFGHIYSMEGFGSQGYARKGLVVYGAAKRSVRYMNEALHHDLKDTGVLVSSIGPGMVITDFVLDQKERLCAEEWQQTVRAFNMFGDLEPTVTSWLAERVLANEKGGAMIDWLPPRKAFWRVLCSMFRKRDIFAEWEAAGAD